MLLRFGKPSGPSILYPFSTCLTTCSVLTRKIALYARTGSRFARAPEVDLLARFFMSNHINKLLIKEMKLYLFHDIVDALRTAFRSLHSVSFFYMFDHISKWYSRIRNPTEWVDFPQKYSEAPHVTLAWELLGLQSLRSSPFNG